MNRCTRQPPTGGIRWLPRAQFDAILARAQVDPCVLEQYPLEPLATFRDRRAHAAFIAAMRARPTSD
jgi:hypothetical protein